MRFYIALWAGKFINFLINVIDKSRGSNFSGEKAIKIDPKMIAGFKGLDPQKTLFITGTNGKSTSNNLIYHIFSADGKKVISNLEGANLMAGLATALIKNSSLAGKVKADYFIFEVDERFLPSIYRLLPAKNILVTNLQKDQVHRNGDPDFIYRKLLPVMKEDVRLFLNNDEPRSRSFAGYNVDVVTYGVERHAETFTKDETFPTMACPVCHGKIDFEYYNNDGMGKFICSRCGIKSQAADYTVTDADFKEKKFSVEGIEFSMPYDIPYMLYNYAAAVAVCSELGHITVEKCAEAFKSFKNVGGRYEVLQFEGKTIKYLRIKQENPETMQTSINIIASDPSQKMVCIGPGHIPDSLPSYTNTFYMYDCDFSELVKGDVEKYLFFTKYVCYDAAIRLKYEGVSPDKIQIIEGEDAKDILDAIRKVKTDNVYIITWIHTFNDMQKQARLKEKEEQ
ncbi:MAG: DUF1727 domain-containing protein [Firmicutes bacterium]|nr:DUF1727 domain-containing protein [Bacillota bacterium]